MDTATFVILVDQIAGVEDATSGPVKAMSAVGRSRQNEHHAPCQAYISNWPIAAELALAAFRGTPAVVASVHSYAVTGPIMPAPRLIRILGQPKMQATHNPSRIKNIPMDASFVCGRPTRAGTADPT